MVTMLLPLLGRGGVAMRPGGAVDVGPGVAGWGRGYCTTAGGEGLDVAATIGLGVATAGGVLAVG